jgi:hypothetical protein
MAPGIAALAMLALLLPVCAGAADSFRGIADSIEKAAARSGVRKVQILPFSSVDGHSTREGRMIAARILTELVSGGDLMVVEGELPDGIPDPYKAAMSGSKGRKGPIVRSDADAVIQGTHLTAGSRIHIDVRLLRLKDRVVLFSASKRVPNEWFDALVETAPQEADEEPKPILASMGPIFDVPSRRAPAAVRDAPSDPFAGDDEAVDCTKTPEEVDRLQSSILDIKARYVAAKLKKAGKDVTQRPPSLITDDGLRNQFDMMVHQWLLADRIPPLTTRETQSLIIVDGKSFELRSRCGL